MAMEFEKSIYTAIFTLDMLGDEFTIETVESFLYLFGNSKTTSFKRDEHDKEFNNFLEWAGFNFNLHFSGPTDNSILSTIKEFTDLGLIRVTECRGKYFPSINKKNFYLDYFDPELFKLFYSFVSKFDIKINEIETLAKIAALLIEDIDEKFFDLKLTEKEYEVLKRKTKEILFNKTERR